MSFSQIYRLVDSKLANSGGNFGVESYIGLRNRIQEQELFFGKSTCPRNVGASSREMRPERAMNTKQWVKYTHSYHMQ